MAIWYSLSPKLPYGQAEMISSDMNSTLCHLKLMTTPVILSGGHSIKRLLPMYRDCNLSADYHWLLMAFSYRGNTATVVRLNSCKEIIIANPVLLDFFIFFDSFMRMCLEYLFLNNFHMGDDRISFWNWFVNLWFF